MDLLVKTRNEQIFAQGNKFFFASNSEDGHLHQYKVLARVAHEANLDKPDLVRSTKLRKYLATMAQVSCIFHSFGNVVCLYVVPQHVSKVVKLFSSIIVHANAGV